MNPDLEELNFSTKVRGPLPRGFEKGGHETRLPKLHVKGPWTPEGPPPPPPTLRSSPSRVIKFEERPNGGVET